MSFTIDHYMNQILVLIALALAAFLGTQAKKLYQKYVTTEIKQNVCRTVVRFVEQVYVDLHGPEKLRQAMARASEILLEYGIKITDTELVAMIEAAVNEFNNAFWKTSGGQGKHEALPEAPDQEVEPVRLPDPETGGTARQDEIIAELFAK